MHFSNKFKMICAVLCVCIFAGFGLVYLTQGQDGAAAVSEMIYIKLTSLSGAASENSFSLVKDRDGYLFYGDFWIGVDDDPKLAAQAIRSVQDLVSESGNVGVVLLPSRSVREEKAYYGIPYANYESEADFFAKWMRYYSVPMLDLRNIAEESGASYEECFYKTSYSLKSRAAFEAYVRMAEWLEDTFAIPVGSDPSLQPQSYKIADFEHGFMGELGETGINRNREAETAQVWAPVQTDEYTIVNEEDNCSGPYSQVIVDSDLFEDGASHQLYLHFDEELTKIYHPDAPVDRRVLLIGDRTTAPLCAMTTQLYTQVDYLRSLSEDIDLMNLVATEEYDDILFVLSSRSIIASRFREMAEMTQMDQMAG